MDICYSGVHIAEGHMLTDITTCNITEPQQKYLPLTVLKEDVEYVIKTTIKHRGIIHELNPLYTGELFHCYMLDKSICHFRGVGSISSLLF